MIITDLKIEYMDEAAALALDNYREERTQVTELPVIHEIPNLDYFAENGLGVAAFEGERLIGFMGCFQPREHAFDTNARGTFSPMHAHGAIRENRAMIYKRMYESAAQKWVDAGINYHCIACYAHDDQMIKAFFSYGFGHRCTDAIRSLEPICMERAAGIMEMEQDNLLGDIKYMEISQSEVSKIRGLRAMSSEHFGKSPCFMRTGKDDFEEWLKEAEKRDSRVFVAVDKEKTIAFMELRDFGENFITEIPDMKNICGAFCLPQYRGKNIYQNLLQYVIQTLRAEGYQRLGVDFESFNPTASGFWLKYFKEYTCSVVRRIDEIAQITE